MRDDQPGCLGGIMRLAALGWIFRWLQENIGFGRGGCSGAGCGVVLVVLLVIFGCSILFGTNWFNAGF